MNEAQKPDTPELEQAIKSAYAGTLRHSAQLLACWRSNLSNERAKRLADFEAKGMTLGILIGAPRGSLLVQAILTDAAGGVQILDTIELSHGGSVVVN